MKEDAGVPNVQAWGCPHAPQEISKETQASKLGDAPRASPSPSTIISSSFIPLYFYHFMRYVLCLERLALYLSFQFSLALFAVHSKLEPSFLCVGEKHAPLDLEHIIGFSCFSLLCVFFIFSQLLSCLALSFHAYLFKSFCLVCCWNSLEFSCLSCLESWLVALSCVS